MTHGFDVFFDALTHDGLIRLESLHRIFLFVKCFSNLFMLVTFV